jgi:P-type Ca2+ transporter type 2C
MVFERNLLPNNPFGRISSVRMTNAKPIALAWPSASELFRSGPLHADDLALTVTVGLLTFGVLELVKMAFRSRIEGRI